MNDVIKNIFKDELKISADLDRIEKLHGDASYRTYFRAYLKDGSTYIIMQMPLGKSAASEEITNYEGSSKELPFINVDNYLKKIGINVPCVLRYSDDDRIMVLEDLGDQLLANIIQSADEKALLVFYKNAIDLLISIQKDTENNPDTDCVAFNRSFDATLLNWEFDHFLEYAFEAQGIILSGEELSTFKNQTRSITQKIEQMEYGFTLRDYQSRNIIIKDNLHYIIDFQDALMGPRLYDLVSLLRDSYIRLDNDTMFHLVDYYANNYGRDKAEVRKDFDLITVQRKMKDTGRFIYIDRVKNNSSYLKFIPDSAQYVVSALKRIQEHEPLLNIILKYQAALVKS